MLEAARPGRRAAKGPSGDLSSGLSDARAHACALLLPEGPRNRGPSGGKGKLLPGAPLHLGIPSSLECSLGPSKPG